MQMTLTANKKQTTILTFLAQKYWQYRLLVKKYHRYSIAIITNTDINKPGEKHGYHL